MRYNNTLSTKGIKFYLLLKAYNPSQREYNFSHGFNIDKAFEPTNKYTTNMGKNMANYPCKKQAPRQHPTRTKNEPKRSNQCIALRDIKKYQETTDLLIKGLPFQRLVRNIAMQYNTELKFQRAAIEALQEGSEAFLVKLFELTGMFATHANRVTILRKDVRLAIHLKRIVMFL